MMKAIGIPTKLSVLAVMLAAMLFASFIPTPAYALSNITSIDISGLPAMTAGEKAPADESVTLTTGNANTHAQYLGVWKASDLASVQGSEEPLPFEGTFVEGEKYVAMIYVETAPGYLFAKSPITGDPAMLQAVLKMIQVEPGSDIDKILSYFGAFTGSVKLPQGYVVNNAAGGGFDFAPLVFDVPGNKDGEMTDPEHSILIVQAETTAKANNDEPAIEGDNPSQNSLDDSKKSPKTGVDDAPLAIALFSSLMGAGLFGALIARSRKSDANQLFHQRKS